MTGRQQRKQTGTAPDGEMSVPYVNAGSDLDLAGEIGLLRSALDLLRDDVRANYRPMAAFLGVLLRTVDAQAKHAGHSSQVERMINAMAEAVVKRGDSHDAAG